HHVFGDVERLRRKHGAEDADDQIEAAIGDVAQVAGIALLKREVREARFLGPPVAGVDEVPRDVDAEHIRAEVCRRQRRRSVAASEIENIKPFVHAEALDERLAALSHAAGNTSEVALFPQSLVWIHSKQPSLS